MSAMLLSAILIGLRPQLMGVSFRSGLHSYQQLAKELTDQGMTVQCDPSIAQRYALVRVPQMDWKSLQPVLEAALGIQFVQNLQGTLEIRKDPKEAGTEAALLKKLARRYSQTIQNAVRDGFDDYLQLLDLKARRNKEDPVSDVLAAISSLPSGDSDRNALSVAINLLDRVGQRWHFAQLWDGVNLVNLLKNPVAVTTLSEQFDPQSLPDNPIGGILPPPVRSFGIRLADGEPGLPNVLIERWRVDTRSFALSKDVVTVDDTDSLDDSNVPSDIVPTVIEFDCSWDDLYRGQQGEPDYKGRVKSTAKWLSTDMATEPIAGLEAAKSISEFFERWSEESHKPIVMEITMNRESVYDPFTVVQPGSSIAGLMRSRAQEIRNVRLMRTPWTIADLDGITVVRNELRFVDHLIPFNPSALISLQMAREKSANRTNSIRDLVDAAALATGEEQASAMGYETFGQLAEFPAVCPYLRLISSEPNSLRKLVSIQAGQLLKFPVSSFSESAKRRFEGSLRRISELAPHLWSSALWTDYKQELLTSTVAVLAIGQADHAVLQFELSPDQKKGRKALFPTVSVGPVLISN